MRDGLTEMAAAANVSSKTRRALPKFCTRERFTLYFKTEVKENGGLFSDQEIDSVLNELDPFFTGVI